MTTPPSPESAASPVDTDDDLERAFLEEDAAVAFVLDRMEQYKPSSGTYHALALVAEALARGDHLEAFRHGELDDLAERVRNMRRG